MDNPKTILSASRRTDIPGCYSPWFLDGITRGQFTITNPFNRQSRIVDVTPQAVHTIVFWSKNIGPFLDLNLDRILTDKGYHLFFNLTVNATTPLLEPGIPDLNIRLAQIARLCRTIDPSQISWRFDPICFYRVNGESATNMFDFEHISTYLSDLGIRRCITSFYDPYKKVNQRIRRLAMAGKPQIEFTDPDMSVKKGVIQKMAGQLAEKGVQLYLCCEAELLDALGLQENIASGACIDGRLYKRLFGGTPETAKDYGQRRQQGCQCTRSVDIGSYAHHPCYHNCLFCYARTENDLPARKPGHQ